MAHYFNRFSSFKSSLLCLIGILSSNSTLKLFTTLFIFEGAGITMSLSSHLSLLLSEVLRLLCISLSLSSCLSYCLFLLPSSSLFPDEQNQVFAQMLGVDEPGIVHQALPLVPSKNLLGSAGPGVAREARVLPPPRTGVEGGSMHSASKQWIAVMNMLLVIPCRGITQ